MDKDIKTFIFSCVLNDSVFILLILSILTIYPFYSFANDTEKRLRSAQTERIKASNDYFNSLMKLGPNPTTQQKEELRNKILVPAEGKFSNELNRVASQRANEIRQAIVDTLKKHFPVQFFPKWLTHPHSLHPDSGKTSVKKDTPHFSTNKEDAPQPSQPELIVDGSKFSKELTFRGVKIKGQPEPSPSPSPSPELQVEGIQKLDIIEFAPRKKP